MGKYLQTHMALFIHSSVDLTTGPQPLPKRVLHKMRASASSFNIQCPLFPLKLSSSCLRLLPCLPVTYFLPSVFLAINGRRQFLRNVWPIQSSFLLRIVCSIFLSSLNLCNTSFLTRTIQLIFSILLQHHILTLFRYFSSTLRSAKVSATHKAKLQMPHFTSCFLKFTSNLSVKEGLRLAECCFCQGNPGLNSTCKSCIICYHGTRTVKKLYTRIIKLQ